MRKQKIKFLKSISYFIPFASLFYIMLVCFFGYYSPGIFEINLNKSNSNSNYTFKKLAEVKQIKNVDILFLGSSHSFRSFDTRIFKKSGFTSYNLGTNSQTPIQTEALLNRYLKSINPKIIVYEVYPVTFSTDGIESSLDIISKENNDLNSFYLALKQNHISVYNTLIYSFFSSILTNKQKEKVKDDDYVIGGFVQKRLMHFKHTKFSSKKYDFKEAQFLSFEKNLDLIKKSGIKLFLVEAPWTKASYNSYLNNEYFDEKMKSYGNYYNFNKLIHLDDSLHFYDESHLNQNGVIIFNKSFITMLLSKK